MGVHEENWKNLWSAADEHRAVDPLRLAHLVYLMQGLAPLAGVPALIGVLLNYRHRAAAKGTLAESHFNYQIRTFWGGMILLLVGVSTLIMTLGFYILGFAGLWYVYRIVKGWSALSDQRPMRV